MMENPGLRLIVDYFSQHSFDLSKALIANRGKTFEYIACYMTNTVCWALLGLGKDNGIDGVNAKVVMQAKYRSGSTLPQQEIDKFIIRAKCNDFKAHERVLCVNEGCNVPNVSTQDCKLTVITIAEMRSSVNTFKQLHGVFSQEEVLEEESDDEQETIDYWLDNYKRLKEHISTNLHLPSSNSELGKWINIQCTECLLYKHSNYSALTNEQYALIDGLCVTVNETVWVSNYNMLRDYMVQHGRLPLQKSNIGRWSARQRKTINLSPFKRRMMDELIPLGWYWTVLTDEDILLTILTKYTNTFNKLPDFRGHHMTSCAVDGYNIKPIVRRLYKAGTNDAIMELLRHYRPNHRCFPSSWH